MSTLTFRGCLIRYADLRIPRRKQIDDDPLAIQEDEELIAAIMNNRTGGSNASTKI